MAMRGHRKNQIHCGPFHWKSVRSMDHHKQHAVLESEEKELMYLFSHGLGKSGIKLA